jgi:integrase
VLWEFVGNFVFNLPSIFPDTEQSESFLRVQLESLGRFLGRFLGRGKTMKLTATTVRTEELPKGKREQIFFDSEIPGLGLRIREGGTRSLIYQYKIGPRNRRMTLGRASPATLTEMRKVAAQLYARIKLGQDPAGEKVEAKRAAAETFKPYVEQFLQALQAHYRPRSFKQVERHLLKHAKSLHGLPLGKIDRRDIATVIVSVTNASGATTANRVRSSCSSFFTWAISHGLVEHNPVDGAPRHAERSRDRVLTPAELRLIWNSLEDNEYGAIVKLLALSAQRVSEIGALRWREIGADQILLPAERTKNHRSHVIPLSAPAAAIIATQPKREGSDTLFGSEHGFTNWNFWKERLDKTITQANGGKPIPRWTTHDLRRTAATMMADDLGIQPHIIEAILNHVSGHKAGVAGIYNRASYLREKRAALDLWADRLLAIAEGRDSNIVAMPRREA